MSSDKVASRPNTVPLNDSGEFLRAGEVAHKLGISLDLVHRLLREKRLPGFKMGRVWLISRNDLHQYLMSLKAASDRSRR